MRKEDWIKVEDKLPKIKKGEIFPVSETVLVTDGDNVYKGNLVKYDDGDTDWELINDEDDTLIYINHEITHWQEIVLP